MVRKWYFVFLLHNNEKLLTRGTHHVEIKFLFFVFVSTQIFNFDVLKLVLDMVSMLVQCRLRVLLPLWTCELNGCLSQCSAYFFIISILFAE